VCPNCLKEDRIGFKGVCMVFKTFICHDCKSAHQSFSHRTKSVDMSVWKMEEVKVLDERNGGGNRVALQHWLACVPEGERPNKDSSLDDYKKFIQKAYNDELWISGGPSSGIVGASTPATDEVIVDGDASGHRKHKKDKKDKSWSKSRGRTPEPSPMGDFAMPNGGCSAVPPDVAWTNGGWFHGVGPQGEFGPSQTLQTHTPGSCYRDGMHSQQWQEGAYLGDSWQHSAGGTSMQHPLQPFADVSPVAWEASPMHSAPTMLPLSLSHESNVAHNPDASASSTSGGAFASSRFPLHSTNPWMPPIDPTNPWADVLLRRHLGIVAPT